MHKKCEHQSLLYAICKTYFFQFVMLVLICQHLLILKYLFQEFYLRRLHNLLTDFIIQMPLKQKELRNKAEDAAKTYNQHMQVSNPTLSFHRLTRGHQPNKILLIKKRLLQQWHIVSGEPVVRLAVNCNLFSILSAVCLHLFLMRLVHLQMFKF